MNIYKIQYKNGESKIVHAEKSIDVVKHYDLATKENINTRIFQLEGEELIKFLETGVKKELKELDKNRK